MAAIALGALAAGLALRAGGDTAGATVEIASPASGATVRSPVTLDVALQGSTLGSPGDGLDHLHISLDGGQPIAEYGSPRLVLPLIPPGPHTLAVELAGPDHAPLRPASEVGFTVVR